MNAQILPDIGWHIMNNALLAFLLIFVSLLASVEIGRRAQRRKPGAIGGQGVSLLDGAVFALLGLLVGFSFSAAAGRFEARRDLVIAEANAIGTASKRLDLLAEEDRAALKGLFAAYVQGRLETYSTPAYGERLFAELKKDKEMQEKIWQRTVDALDGGSTPPNAAILLPQALNEMFDVANTRAQLLTAHNPPIVYLLLWASALVAGLLAGYGMDLQSRKGRVHEVGFAIVITLALYVIVDFDYPRRGLIRLDDFDRALAAQL